MDGKEKPKAGRVVRLNISDPRLRKSARDGARPLEEFNQLARGDTLAELVRSTTSAGMLKDALASLPSKSFLAAQMEAHQDAVKAFKEAHDRAFGGLPEGYLDTIRQANSAVSQFQRDMAEYGEVVSHNAEAFGKLQRAIRDSALFDLSRFVSTPQIFNALEVLGGRRFSSAIEEANATLKLGLPSTFHEDLRTATIAFKERAAVLAEVGPVHSTFDFKLDVEASLSAMLARSIVAREDILEEMREARAEVKSDALLNRRHSTLTIIINVLLLLITLFNQIDDRIDPRKDIISDKKEVLVEVRESVASVASQLEELKENQKSYAESKIEADAEIADILRDIAALLSQEGETDAEAEVEEAPPQ